MTRAALVALTGLAGLMVSAFAPGLADVGAGPIAYKLPDETAAFKPGLDMDIVQSNCTTCHSVDYIQTQPRGPKFKRDFWQAEVTKMIKVYGAPIDEADIGKIVEYLAQTY
jgi:hypothetical protein